MSNVVRHVFCGVGVWHVFAYKIGDEDGAEDKRQKAVDWELAPLVNSLRDSGYDTILIERDRGESDGAHQQGIPEGPGTAGTAA